MPIRTRNGKTGRTYQAWYRDRGKYVAKTFDRRADAQEWLNLEQATPTSGSQPRRSGLMFDDFCDQWLVRYKSDVKHCTYDNARKFVKNWIKPNLGNYRLDEINDVDLIELREKAVEMGRSNRTANYILSVVSKMFSDAADAQKQWKLRLMNPASVVKPLSLELKDLSYWDFDEVTRFLSIVKRISFEDYVFFAFLLNTGARVGETCALHWDQLNLQRESCQIRRNVDWTRMSIEKTTKSHELRVIGLGASILPLLKELHISQGRPPGERLVFSNVDGKLRSLSNITRRSFHPCIEAADVRQITIHDLRHTFAAHFVMNGGTIYDLKKILGHRNIQVTERYAHLSPEYIQKQTSLVGFSASGTQVAR